VAAPGNVSNAILTKSQLDPYYLPASETLATLPVGGADKNMGGYTFTNVRDAVANLDVTNLAQVQSLIASGGFKNRIQSQSNHAQVVCNQPSDTVSIKANNANTTLDISSDGINKYTLTNSGEIDISASNLNVNGNAMQIVGTGGGGTAFFASDIRCTQSDLGFSDQVLTRAQNDARYLPSATTTLSTIPAPTSSVSFGNQLLRNL